MPLIHYLCNCKHSIKKFHRQGKDAPAYVICSKCGEEAKKQLSAPYSASKIIVDNGSQARSTEVNLEIVEDIKERSSKDFKEN